MTTTSVDRPAGRPVTPRQLEWLQGEVRQWRAEGLIGADAAEAILANYRAVRRLSLGRLLLGLGAAFVGIGLIWLVASNLDQLSPLVRFGLVTAIWLGLVGWAHALAERRRVRGLEASSPVVGALRGLAAAAYGAVVFQAAQSLQVPAYTALLVGIWSLGALVYAYAVRGLAPLLLGIVTGVVWLLWQVIETSENGLDAVLALVGAGAVAVGVAALHARFRPVAFVAAWREVGALLVLVGLFVSAVPEVEGSGFRPTAVVVGVGVVAVLLAAVASVVSRDESRLEPAVAVLVAVVAVGLVLWESDAPVDGHVVLADVAQAVTSVGLYIIVAGLVAARGVTTDSPRLTWLAVAALVIFTTFQAFAVFSEIVTGAWLFLVLGLVFAGTGFLADRGRRELESTLKES